MGVAASVECQREQSSVRKFSDPSEISKRIDKELAVDYSSMLDTIKLLILGAGESGKSTLLKQMRIHHCQGFTEQERLIQRVNIRLHTVESIRHLVLAMSELNIDFSSTDRLEDARTLFSVELDSSCYDDILIQLLCPIKRLWQDSGVQECFSRSCQFQLNDNTKYFLDGIDRLTSPSYLPTDDDVLKVRVKTTGIVETCFSFKNRNFRVFDVGGQRTDRRKWIHQFDNVNAILFLVAVSEYDQQMREEPTMNRLIDAVNLFRSTIKLVWFRKTHVILFLNKIDLFLEKVTRIPITSAFPSYQGPLTFEDSLAYIERKLLHSIEESRTCYVHHTCATDTSQMKTVINCSIDSIIGRVYKCSGLT